MEKSIKSSDTQSKWYFLFSKHGCLSFLIKYLSDQYFVFGIHDTVCVLLIWFLSTVTLGKVSLLENHYATQSTHSHVSGTVSK